MAGATDFDPRADEAARVVNAQLLEAKNRHTYTEDLSSAEVTVG